MNKTAKLKLIAGLIAVAPIWVGSGFALAYLIDDHSGVVSSWWAPPLFGIPTLPFAFMVVYCIQDVLAIIERRKQVGDYVRMRESIDQPTTPET